MQDITKIANYGKNSLLKARRTKPRAYRRKTSYAAFTIKSSRADGPRYLVRILHEGRSVKAECVDVVTGEPCKGFSHAGHCYHVGRALTLGAR